MTDPDPRIEAVARVVAVPIHTFTGRLPADGVPWGCEGCRELAAVLTAADAVDPLRQPGVFHSVGGANRVPNRPEASDD